MNLILTKIIVLFTLLLGTFVSSMLPLVILKILQARSFTDRTAEKIRNVISLISCFAAGIFLGTCLLDLFPDVQEKFLQYFKRKRIASKFPFSEFIVIMGLLLMLFVEQTILSCKHRKYKLNLLLTSESSISNEGSEDERQTEISSSCEIDNQLFTNSPFRSFMLLTALSLHSVFEGLAIGLETNEILLLQIFLAVALHKIILAFSLGVNLIQGQLSAPAVFKSNILFCLTSPIGIVIGILVNKYVSGSVKSEVVDGTLQGLAAGTFLYVVFFEIFPHEFGQRDYQPSRLLKFLSLLFGYATICGIILLQKF